MAEVDLMADEAGVGVIMTGGAASAAAAQGCPGEVQKMRAEARKAMAMGEISTVRLRRPKRRNGANGRRSVVVTSLLGSGGLGRRGRR